VLSLVGTAMFVPLALGWVGPDDIVLATSACFVAVYVLTLAAARRMLTGVLRAAATVALVLFCGLAPFLGWWLLLPVATAAGVVAVRRARPSPADEPAAARG
jgi:amino acid efflux transporter